MEMALTHISIGSDRRRSSLRHRDSISSNGSSQTRTTAHIDENDHEMYSGAASEVIPSSISSFHHVYHRTRSPRMSESSAPGDGEWRGRVASMSLDGVEEEAMLRPVGSNSSSVDLHERSHFKFFTSDEIERAHGSSTMENGSGLEPIDYDTNWNTLEFDDAAAAGASRPGSVASLRASQSAARTVSSSRRSAASGSRARNVSRNRSLSVTSSAFDKRASKVQDYGSHENSPVRRGRGSASSYMSAESPLLADDDGDDGDDGGEHKRSRKHRSRTDPANHDYYFKDLTATVQSQRFYIAEEDLVIGIAGYRDSRWKKAVYYVLCVVSCGLAFLFFKWYPKQRIRCMGDAAPLGKADWVVVENEYGELSIVDVERRWLNRRLSAYLSLSGGQDADGYGDGDADADADARADADSEHYADDPVVPVLVKFEYRYMAFYYSPLEDVFKTNLNWSDDAWTDVAHAKAGLSQELHRTRLKIFGHNEIDIREKPVVQLLVDEVLHPFYVFQVFSIVLWLCDDYFYYAACIAVISVVSVVQTTLETKQTTARLKAVSRLDCDVRVFRNDFWTEISSRDLVPGDVYEVGDPSLGTFPCDSLLLNGDCIVNESMLTGESVPVSKSALPHAVAAHLPREFRSPKISGALAKAFLYSGTKIIRARSFTDEPAMAVVVRTGFNTTKGALVRSMLFPKPAGFKFYEDSFKYIGFMTAIAMCGFVFSAINFVALGLSYKLIVLRALDIVTVVVPPALPATLTIGTSFALARLRRSQIFCISPSRVNVGGKLDVICFDKTGTLTEDGLDVFGVHLSAPAAAQRFESTFHELAVDVDALYTDRTAAAAAAAPDEHVRKAQMLRTCLVSCHSLKAVDGELVGDPLDFKMFDFTRWQLVEDHDDVALATFKAAHRLPPNLSPCVLKPPPRSTSQDVVLLKEFDFVSQLRRMSVLVKSADSASDVHVFTKGAPEVMAEICTPESFPANYSELLHHYTHNGYRVIACAGKRLPAAQYNAKSHTDLHFVQELSRDECETRLEFLGFIVFENKLKPQTAGVLRQLNAADLRTVMCTGDNVLTAISVARESHLVTPGTRVYVPVMVDQYLDGQQEILAPPALVWEEVDDPDLQLDAVTLEPLAGAPAGAPETVAPETAAPDGYCLAVTGDVFKFVLTDESQSHILHRMLMKGAIFARMSPDEKHELVEQLQKIDYTVGFCGDGANDCGALKAADVGISLSEAEASVAAPFTSRVFEISCVLDVVREGRASLVTSFSCFQYMSLYSAIQFVSISILYKRGSNLGDFQFLYIDLFLILPIAIFMSWSRPFETLCVKRPTANLVSPKILIPLICNILLVAAFQIVLWMAVQREPWYIRPVPGGDDAVQSSDNTVLFEFSNFQYILSAMVLAVGPPYREPLTRNLPFIANVAVAVAVSVAIMFVPPDSAAGALMQLTHVDFDFKAVIVAAFVLNFVAMDVGYKHAFLWLARFYKKAVYGQRRSKKLFKNLKLEYNSNSV